MSNLRTKIRPDADGSVDLTAIANREVYRRKLSKKQEAYQKHAAAFRNGRSSMVNHEMCSCGFFSTTDQPQECRDLGTGFSSAFSGAQRQS